MVEGSAPPEGYVVIAQESNASKPFRARSITAEQRERYLRLGELLVQSLVAQELPIEAHKQYLEFYRTTGTVEPGFGYFDDLDRFEQNGHL